MTEDNAETPASRITDAGRAWAREQTEKHGPVPSHIVEHLNRLRREQTARPASKKGGPSH